MAGELLPLLGHISSDGGRVTPSAWEYFLSIIDLLLEFTCWLVPWAHCDESFLGVQHRRH